MSGSFRDLEVWRIAFRLATKVGAVVRSFSPADRIDFGSQLVKSAISIPSNIAEGAGRVTPHDQRRFYIYSRASLNEFQTQFEVSAELGLIRADDREQIASLILNCRKALSGLIKAAEKRCRRQTEN